jgi:branched-subunit amino acid ABC-type transport system permease component
MTRARAVSIHVLGLLIVLVTTFLRWARTGRQWRSSYDLFAVARRVGFTNNRVFASALRLWVLLPALIGLALVFAAFHRPRIGAAVGVAVGAVAVSAGAAVLISKLHTGAAPWSCLGAGILVLISGVAAFIAPASREQAEQ